MLKVFFIMILLVIVFFQKLSSMFTLAQLCLWSLEFFCYAVQYHLVPNSAILLI